MRVKGYHAVYAFCYSERLKTTGFETGGVFETPLTRSSPCFKNLTHLTFGAGLLLLSFTDPLECLPRWDYNNSCVFL